ncbi:MAG TPA: outer membrane beta-barrel protein, partial [Steroidobacteraceae bacterium]|nr:outer membrane beta-barrel protein [Steroidobacteraceae bacterium]
KMAALLALFAAPGVLLAADNGIYLGSSVGQANVEVEDGLPDSFDADDTGYKFILGIRPLDWLAIEASYVDFGKPDDRVDGVALEADLDGLSAFGVGFLAVGPVDLFAKAGLINWDAKLNAPDVGLSDSDDGTDFAYGVGAQFRIWSLSLRAEYEIFDIDGAEDVNLLSVGVTWTFL